jgi:hypothetical protein
MSCSCAHFYSSSVSIIIWPKRLGSPRLPLHMSSLDLSTSLGKAPRRGSEMMQRAFSRTVRNLSFSISFSTRQTRSVVLGILDRVSPCSEFADHMDSALKITVQTRHSGLRRGTAEGSNRQSNRFSGFGFSSPSSHTAYHSKLNAQ